MPLKMKVEPFRARRGAPQWRSKPLKRALGAEVIELARPLGEMSGGFDARIAGNHCTFSARRAVRDATRPLGHWSEICFLNLTGTLEFKMTVGGAPKLPQKSESCPELGPSRFVKSTRDQ
jgi:hypothetical protein